MKKTERIVPDRYVNVEYSQFNRSPLLKAAMAVGGVISLPFVLPLAFFARLSDVLFLTCSQAVSLIPYGFGEIVRLQFYRLTLRHCGRNVMIGFGTVLHYRDISIGDNVLIGIYNTIHHCDFGSYVLTAEGCRFLSGARYHNFERIDIPVALQGGALRRIQIGDDAWVGADCVVMDDIGSGAIVGAGSVVRKPVISKSVSAGNPCRLIRMRSERDSRKKAARTTNGQRTSRALSASVPERRI